MNKTKLSLFFLSIITAIVLSEFILRFRFTGNLYIPTKEIKHQQSQLKLHNSLGFIWKENLDAKKNIVITYSDKEPYQLYTDDLGFRNLPGAIEAKDQGKRINIIGLGDSFIHDAAYEFNDFFNKNQVFYYNMAMHRYSPPQYNIIFKDYVIALKPDWVIYGVYENDFEEIIDFEKWEKSGVDWFSYHSGLWYGPSQDFSWLERFILKHNIKGFYSLHQAIMAKINKRFPQNDDSIDEQERVSRYITQPTDKMAGYIATAYQLAKENNIKFLLVIIPSKYTIVNGTSFDWHLFNEVLGKIGRVPILDLREKFMALPGKSLYYNLDGHWNRIGILEAAKEVLLHIKSNSTE